ncbi:glucans biosynthesis glucosyltransferase H [Aureimonas endophytica]|uniref:Glucans biosynthesis glucosyltransferase H n=1 Tax=Aureimonas endophytica TaxID=2027858 RepID=A0A916ZXL8_9HYPH|nr:glucans biosynthesis glucosyltransferase MdoH [Aureimonas endophytica]GGE17183.1 glucans biosynthesis glucosyltransferase H [Aureimonas endophytica]
MIAFRRFLFAATAVILALVAGALFAVVVTASGTSRLQVLQVTLLTICCVWLAWGFNTALTGIFAASRERRSVPVPRQMTLSRTAVLVPVYNEDADSVFARVAAMMEGLRSIGRLENFDFYILSDSTKASHVEHERRSTYTLLSELHVAGHLYYRNREKNVGRKAGNIADFVTRNGGAYEYMLVLDADSLMRPQTILEMVTRMDAEPDLGLLQTQPLIIGRRTPFGRALQFSAALYSPIFSRGIAALQGREGPFWGHNAIIRVRAFAACCGMPSLPGKAPFGGHILSHDFVEAALLSRGGWRVRVDPDLEGSYEEAPSNLIEYAKRDRRWCQGNLQHGKLVLAPRFNLWSRISMITGIMAYAASPIWLMFIIVSLLDPIIAAEPNYFPADSLFPVFPTPETGKALLLLFGIFLLLLLPKFLIAFASAVTARRRAFGSSYQVLAGAFVELVMTSILAPVMMMFQSKAVAEILLRLDSGWPSTDRDDGKLPLGMAFKASWWMVIFGMILAVTTLAYSPELFLWMLPIAGPLLISPILISVTGDPELGDAMRRAGLLSTPFELDPEPVIRASETWRRRLEAISGRLAAAPDAAAPVRPGLAANPA